MGKKRRSKPKPLLSVKGIVHLQNSFVQPSEENGLLTTVGGSKESKLVLAPNYGYGIPASEIAAKENSNDKENHEEESNSGTEQSETDLAESANGSANNNQRSSDKGDNEESVAQLVRNIGGGKGLPLYKKDVVEDRNLPAEKEPEVIDLEPMDEETKAQTEEFYASLGLKNPNQANELVGINTSENTAVAASPSDQQQPQTSSQNTTDVTPQTDSIADYYKTYCKYYYSVTPDPLSEYPLDFNSMIDPATDPNIDESVIELARMAQKARRAMDSAIAAKRAETQKLKKKEESKMLSEIDAYDPLPMEVVENEYEVANVNSETTLTQYWDYVKENPHDFNRWTYLIHYAETMNNLAECRKVYSAFLPIYPYCYGYWKRYAEIEKAYHYVNRALSILARGLDFTPLSVDLWLSYLNLFSEIHAHDNNVEDLIRGQFIRGLRTLGLEFKSDAYWETYIQWEENRSNMRAMFALYRKLIQVPTRLYNRHFDNVKALIRDHHPRDFLSKIEYERMRKRGCKFLKLKYKEEPELEPGEIRKTSKPEDKLMAHVKEVLLEKLELQHAITEKEVDKRWDFEDKIKRPYFHVKAIDKKQLANWDNYLNFEIKEGNHDRIVLLFERCITACAHYEYYWCKYARYLENYHKKNTKEVSVHFQKSQINVELVSKKETEEEESRVEAALSIVENLISTIERAEQQELDCDVQSVLENVLLQVTTEQCDNENQSTVQEIFTTDIIEKVNYLSSIQDDEAVSSANLDGHSNSTNELPPKPEELNSKETEPTGFTSLLSVPTFPPARYHWQEVVRDIYKRGSIVHCPRKPTLRLQWASYEEELGNINEARQLIQHVLEWFPDLLEAKLQMLELERRNGNNENLIKLYDDYLSATELKDAFSIISLKYATFLFKELGKPDKALLVLRKAVNRDKGNIRIYLAIYSICFERFPTDRKGALASLELAIQSKQLTDEEKFTFVKKKVLFLQDHGDLVKYRDAVDQFNLLQDKLNLAKEEELKLKAYDVPNQFEIPKENLPLHPFPAPGWSKCADPLQTSQKPTPISYENTTEKIVEQKSTEAVSDEYKNVPPTRELLVTSDYGYSYKHPEQKYISELGHKQYEQLESKGYPEHLKTKEGEESSSSSKKRKSETPLYIVAPKGSFLMSYLGGPNNLDNPPVPGGVYLEGVGNKRMKLEAPMEMSSLILPTNSPCINVPEWFVKEGGELCLSETSRGFSILRYWPHFLSEIGDKKMFKRVRRSVKWHQKQIMVGGKWRHIPRLISWLGPCDYSHNGMVIEKNENWPPEILDLLHRLIQMTHYEFNSCSLNLYRSGHDSNAWHSDLHKALGSNPPVASVSLGSLRYFEMRKKGYEQNFIRFPLFPGSLLIMEGATQEDWLHQVPKDPSIKAERINMTFRIMHAIDLDEPEALLIDASKFSMSKSEANKENDKQVQKEANPVPATTTGEVAHVHSAEIQKSANSVSDMSDQTRPKESTSFRSGDKSSKSFSNEKYDRSTERSSTEKYDRSSDKSSSASFNEKYDQSTERSSTEKYDRSSDKSSTASFDEKYDPPRISYRRSYKHSNKKY